MVCEADMPVNLSLSASASSREWCPTRGPVAGSPRNFRPDVPSDRAIGIGPRTSTSMPSSARNEKAPGEDQPLRQPCDGLPRPPGDLPVAGRAFLAHDLVKVVEHFPVVEVWRVDGVPGRAEPICSSYHPGPEPQYKNGTKPPRPPKLLPTRRLTKLPSPFRKRDLSLRVLSRPPKEEGKPGPARNSQIA